MGVIFEISSNYNGSFKVAQKELYDKGTKAMLSLIGKCRKLDLPIDIQIKLFNSLVKPIVLYGAEVWGSQNTYLCNQLQLRFLKIILGLRKKILLLWKYVVKLVAYLLVLMWNIEYCVAGINLWIYQITAGYVK